MTAKQACEESFTIGHWLRDMILKDKYEVYAVVWHNLKDMEK
jgi:hypothetical protein